MPWYISEPVKSGWQMESSFLVKQLKDKWPNAEIKEIQGSERENFSREWKIPFSTRILEGSFNHYRSAVVLDGDIEDAAAFATWFRSLVPEQQKLYFYDEGYLMHVDLRSETTEADIVAATRI